MHSRTEPTATASFVGVKAGWCEARFPRKIAATQLDRRTLAALIPFGMTRRLSANDSVRDCDPNSNVHGKSLEYAFFGRAKHEMGESGGLDGLISARWSQVDEDLVTYENMLPYAPFFIPQLTH